MQKESKTFLEARSIHLHKDSAKRRNKELQVEAELKKKQVRTRAQCVGLIGEEFSKKCDALPSDFKVFFAGMSKEEFAEQVSTINSFNVGSFKSTPKKSKSQRRRSHSQPETFS